MKINDIKIVPKPRVMETHAGAFILSNKSRIIISDEKIVPLAELLREYLTKATGYELAISQLKSKANDIVLSLDKRLKTDSVFPDIDESYKLMVEQGGLHLNSNTLNGLCRGIQTLRQLFPVEIFSLTTMENITWKVPFCYIEDKPEFRWRGMHLDVSRHFFDVETICRFIDLIALHRLNVLHLHLTDDQGWRIEIKKYPKLTKIGSKRSCTLTVHERSRPRKYDNTPYGGFFTQIDIKKIVEYASKRYITIVPEVDMPGHMQAAISAYPEIGCTDMKLQPRCHWGISQHILNVNESTIEFMKNIIDEIIDLFPSKYIHIGGDEATMYQWSESHNIQNRMIELGIKNEDELQSWFITQMNKHIISRGRCLIGWDEILEGGLSDGAAVMSWRGEEGGIIAAQQKHDVVMTPGSHVYFDHYQKEPVSDEPLAIGGLTTLEKVYSYEPVPEILESDKHRYIMGSQGQLWAEYIHNRDHLDYMAFPRTCALSEVLWCKPADKNYEEFVLRMKHHLKRFDNIGVKYCKSVNQ